MASTKKRMTGKDRIVADMHGAATLIRKLAELKVEASRINQLKTSRLDNLLDQAMYEVGRQIETNGRSG